MNFHEIALLMAVATPVVVVFGLNIVAAFAGEALLIPLPRPFASIAIAEDPIADEPSVEPVVETEPLREAA